MPAELELPQDAAAAGLEVSAAAEVAGLRLDGGDGSEDFSLTVPLAEGPNVLAARAGVDAKDAHRTLKQMVRSSGSRRPSRASSHASP